MKPTRLLLLALLLVLAACQPRSNTPDVLPTLIDLNVIGTQDAATAAAVAATATAAIPPTSSVPTLPPTWTPSPVPTDPPTNEPVIGTPTPPSGAGTIYFIFNGDSIAALKADGSDEKLILVGGQPAQMTLSPDGKFLAYSAVAAGSAREVFITTLDGSYVQQVSCLGYARILFPTWSPDSQTLAFGASQTAAGTVEIYRAGVIGSGQCPAGNNQQKLADSGQNRITGLAWDNSGAHLFFSSGSIYGIDATTATLTPPLTMPTGFGPDYSLVYAPSDSFLFYLKSFRDNNTGKTGGLLSQVDTSRLAELPLTEQRGTQIVADDLHFTHDGRYLLLVSANGFGVQDMRLNTSRSLVQDTRFAPGAVFDASGDWITFINAGRGTPDIAQIYIIQRTGDNGRQISFHQEGTISDLNWGAL